MKLYISLAIIVAACTTTPVLSSPSTRQQPLQKEQQDNRAAYCLDPDTREGKCIPIKECQSLVDELLAKPSDQTFVRFLRASNRVCGGAETRVCCPNGRQTQSITSRPLIKSTDGIPQRLPTVEEGCGFIDRTYKKLVGGEVNKKDAWPWIVLIGYDEELSGSPFKCGGTLITARHVITAAHCLLKDLSFVRLGEHDLTTDTEGRHVDIRVVRTEKHPHYNRRNGRHSDIAILYLEHNVNFTAFIAPICMPIKEEYRQKSYVNYYPFVAGWGKTIEGGHSLNVPQELQIPIYDNQVCRESYRQKNGLITEKQFDKAVLCTGLILSGSRICQGDSGGPLMLPEIYSDHVHFYLIGVASYGVGCTRSEVPGVYASTQYFMDWIIQQIANTP